MARKKKAPAEAPASPRPDDEATETPASTAPTAEYVMSLYANRSAEGNEARLRTLMSLFRALCRGEHAVNVPKQYKAITKVARTPFVRDAHERTTAALTQNKPLAHIEPVGTSDEAKRNANLGERWTMAALETLTKQLGENIVYEAAKALVRDGESVIKVVHRPDAWADFPVRDDETEDDGEPESADEYSTRVDAYKRKAQLPFAMRVVDRESMVFGDGEYGDAWALEYGEYPLPYLMDKYGMVESARTGRLVTPAMVLGGMPAPEGRLRSGHGHAVKIEYWTAEWWHVVIDGSDAPGFPKPNPYAPRLPYFRAKSNADSETILYSLKDLGPTLDSLLTMKMCWSYLGAFPNPVVENIPNAAGALDLPTGNDAQPTPIKWAPGKALEPPAGKTIRFLVPPPVGKDLDEMIQIIRAMIDVAGIPSTLRGMSGAGDSGYLANQMLAAVMMMYRRLAVALERQLEQATEFLHYLVAHRVKQCVYVQAETADKSTPGKEWLGLKPKGKPSNSEASVELLGPLNWEFRPILPTDEQARSMVANQLVNAPRPLISKRYALEHYLGVEDPEGMADEIAVEQALEAEPLKSMVLENALREAGLLPPPAPPAPGPMPGGPGGMMPPPGMAGVPGQIAGGMPAIPGLTMPLQPGPPGPPPLPPGMQPQATPGVPGAYPGQPSNQGPPLPTPFPR